MIFVSVFPYLLSDSTVMQLLITLSAAETKRLSRMGNRRVRFNLGGWVRFVEDLREDFYARKDNSY